MATVDIPVAVKTPDSSGNAYPTLVAGTVHQLLVPAFVKDVDGYWYGEFLVPQNYVSGGQIILSLAANATTGVARVNVATTAVADAESLNPGSYTSETAVDVSMPATAYLRKDQEFTLTPTLVAGDLVELRVAHEGAHANDTLAVDLLLAAVTFRYTA